MINMETIKKKTWKEKYELSEDHEFDPAAFLNGVDVEECSQIQQMVYYLAKKSKELSDKIIKLEEKEKK